MAKWIEFQAFTTSAINKTGRWTVASKSSGSIIGFVEWYTPWRKYVFSPAHMTVFDCSCLRDIATFCEEQTKEYKSNKPQRTQQE